MKTLIVVLSLITCYDTDISTNFMRKFVTLITTLQIRKSIAENCIVTNPNKSQVTYWLYNHEYSDHLIKDLTEIDTSKRVIFLFHGWRGNKNVDYIAALRDAYVKRYNDVNVVIPDYEYYVRENYKCSSYNLPYVAKDVANFICGLNQNLNYQLPDIHILGHSLGGQLAGLVGWNAQRTCGKIGRITGLDPAGPLYQDINPKNRLDNSDAIFVDVIYTNRGQLGYFGNVGDVNFYANDGGRQPKCDSIFLNIKLSNIIKNIVDWVTCNHQSGCFYFAESISNNGFYARSAECYSTLLFDICISNYYDVDFVHMGEYLKSTPKDATYSVYTNAKPPYSKGPYGPLE